MCFTAQDCRIGWWIANIRHPELREWLRMRLFCFYSSKRKEERRAEEEATGHRGNAARSNGTANGRNGTPGDALDGDETPF